MAEPTDGELTNLNARVQRGTKRALVAACGPRPDGESNYTLSDVVRIVLARAIRANLHLHIEEETKVNSTKVAS
jgi:hypothetical protein